MKIQLLISTGDRDYAEHLAGVLSEKYAESFDVTVCSAAERLAALQSGRSFDTALTDIYFLPALDMSKVRLPLLLWSEMDDMDGSDADSGEIGKLRKYQRVSAIGSDILEAYAKAAVGSPDFGAGGARVTAVWSPAGGVGKTSVALAYAARLAAGDAGVTYFDLEYFSSVPAYFPESGKSISSAFEHLDRNVALLLKAIELKDSGSGITYFARPDNYDDMNELTTQDVGTLIAAVSGNTDELVIDMPSVCDERCKFVLERADAVFIVTDTCKTAQIKLSQFLTQHNLFEKIREKAALVANRGAKPDGSRFGRVVNLPAVSSNDPIAVYKTLSGVNF